MYFATTFASLVVLAGSAAAGCHGSGITWPGGYHVFVAEAENECRRGRFTGTFGPNEEKYACVQYGNGVKLEFRVKNQNGGASFDLNDDDCLKELRKDIEGCPRGGNHQQSGWYFSADPNEGRC
ncbi:hypothetical protein FLONG3_5214 [Fusarium longipes]|uniref:Glycan binding protein Y3-like domain-containing protein n=1 Tax=Fusarium longipes TaxID=694270 RepID=A0A395SVQ9_9HYPO|nr:hypothetical protein FLONG3_5214 [Fusarium longipes]